MRSIWQRSRMIAIVVIIVLGAGAIALARPHPTSKPALGTSGNATALRLSSPAITAETEPPGNRGCSARRLVEFIPGINSICANGSAGYRRAFYPEHRSNWIRPCDTEVETCGRYHHSPTRRFRDLGQMALSQWAAIRRRMNA